MLLVFKDKSDKAQGNKERASVTLEEICGLEAGQWYEGVAFTLAILCLNQVALLGFDSKEALQAWDARLRYSLGEGEKDLPALVLKSPQYFSRIKTHLISWCCGQRRPQQTDESIHHTGRFQDKQFGNISRRLIYERLTAEFCKKSAAASRLIYLSKGNTRCRMSSWNK